MLVTQVIAHIEKQMGVHLRPQAFINQTLGQIAAVCEEKVVLPQKPKSVSMFRQLWQNLKHVITH
ncbi:MAG: hypothetical protein GY801_51495 [bacterium]|nr:hypothetical protein [bacterium]